MKRKRLFVMLSLLVGLISFGVQARAATPGSLLSLIDLDSMADPAPPGWDAGMFSSTDPTGKGHDCGQFLRVEGNRYVLAEMDGPGVITRIWSANAQGQLQVFIDGQEEPVVDCTFKDLFEDRYPPFTPPIAGKSSGGWYSYWPIAFRRSCKITVHESPEVVKQYAELSATRKVNVPLKGVKELRLVVTKGPEGDYWGDHADWADARLVRADGSVVYLSDVTETSAPAKMTSSRQDWGLLPNGRPGKNGEVGRDVSCEGNPLTINGKRYKKGLGSHGAAEHVFVLNEPFERFESEVGIDDEAGKRDPQGWLLKMRRGTVECRVFTDGKKVYDSGVIGYPKLEGRFEHGSLFYHINYLRLPEGTPIQPFRRELTDKQKRELKTVLSVWNKPGSPPHAIGSERIMRKQDIAPGASAVLADLSGPGKVTSLKMRVESEDKRILRRAILKIRYDGYKGPAVWCPVGDFFGTGFGEVEFKSLLYGMTKEGYYCYFPMPFSRNIRIEIENGSKRPATVSYEITHMTLPAERIPPARFCAQWRSDIGRKGRLYTILDTRGRGKFVGFNLSPSSVGGDIAYLEGNEEFYVDGEEQPSTVGTGTEDYFNGGWYYNKGLFTRPLHGLTVKRQARGTFPDAEGITSQFRVQLADCVPFQKSFLAEIQYGTNSNHLEDRYASVAYWYQTMPVQTDYTPPAASEMNFPRRVLVRPNASTRGALRRANLVTGVGPLIGAVFAENLFADARVKNATKELAYWKDISEGYEGTNMSLSNWWPRATLIREGKGAPTEPHRGDVIVCRSEKPGVELEVLLKNPGAANSSLTLVLVEGPDFGRVDVSIGDEVVLKDVDCYSPEVRPSKIITADFKLNAEPADLKLRIRATGKNPASKGCSLGLYCVRTASANAKTD